MGKQKAIAIVSTILLAVPAMAAKKKVVSSQEYFCVQTAGQLKAFLQDNEDIAKDYPKDFQKVIQRSYWVSPQQKGAFAIKAGKKSFLLTVPGYNVRNQTAEVCLGDGGRFIFSFKYMKTMPYNIEVATKPSTSRSIRVKSGGEVGSFQRVKYKTYNKLISES